MNPTLSNCFKKLITTSLRTHFINKQLNLNTIKFRHVNFQQFSSVSGRRKFDNETKIKIPDDESSYVAAQSDPEIFGTQTPNVKYQNEVDEDDLKEDEFLENPPSRSHKLSTKMYADMIKEHLRNHSLKEAIDVLEVRMLKVDRVKPENYIFNLLIGGCARAGYTQKAFQLFTKMKQRDLKVTGGTYTSLFNACSNSPYLSDGLSKANRLREIMLEKGYEPNASNYNSMIKAFGRCGDPKTGFLLIDEMIGKNMEVKVDSFNFLLQACVSDKEYGFRHALLVWHKMFQKRLTPDLYSFNLLLKCVRESGLGDLQSLEEVLSKILRPRIESHQNKVYLDGEKQIDLGNLPSIQRPDTQQETSPNLISMNPHLGTLVSLSEVKKPEDRLLLIGGASGFLKEMGLAKITPDIKTFTQLLEVIPSTVTSEKQLIATIRKLGIKCDIDFFNILIKKRSMRYDYESAREVLLMIKTAKLHPDIVTYGVLALSCKSQEEARELLQQMYDQGIRMNIQILGAMLRQGCANKNFNYVLEILKICQDQRIQPNEQFITHILNFHSYCVTASKHKHENVNSRKFKVDFNHFNNILDNWKEEQGIKGLSIEDAAKKFKQSPWKQFKTNKPEGFEDEKNQKLRHKSKTVRYIKRVDVEKLK